MSEKKRAAAKAAKLDIQKKVEMYERAMEEALSAMIAGRHKWRQRVVDRVVLVVNLFDDLKIYSYSGHLRDYKLAEECADRVLRRSGLPVDREGWRILPEIGAS
jgi:hypothetical protein